MTRTGTIVGVALLVVVDVVLAVLAWNHVYSGDVGAGVVEEITDSAEAADGTDPTPTESVPAGDDAATAYDAALVADEVVTRAAVRSCEDADGPAVVEVSRDGGASFDAVEVPLAAVRRVQVESADDLVAVGTNGRCEPVARVSGDGGETWEPAPLESAGWSLVGDGQLVSPAGELGDIGCAPAAVSGVTDEDAVVLCDDGGVLRTENGGGFWGRQTTLPFAGDVAFVSASVGYVLVSRGGCDVLVRETTDGGATWRDTQCISAEPPAAVAADGDVLVVLTADGAYRSGDRGDNWEVY